MTLLISSNPDSICFCFLEDSHSDWGERESTVLISISLMAKDVEYFLMHILVICSSFGSCLVHLRTLLVILFVLLVFYLYI